MAFLDVQFVELPGWVCAASYFFITSHIAEYLMARSDQDSVRAAGVTSSLIRNTGIKEVWRYYTIGDLLSDVQRVPVRYWRIVHFIRVEIQACIWDFKASLRSGCIRLGIGEEDADVLDLTSSRASQAILSQFYVRRGCRLGQR
eukprot:1144500-Pelagomonas_calceolata.AAC.1